MTTENKIKCVLMDFEINNITIQEATKQILRLFIISGSASQFEEVIEIPRIEGVLLGLKICKEMFAQGEITHEEIYENEQYYKDELLTLKKKVGAPEL